MPNHIANELLFRGSDKDLEAIQELMNTSDNDDGGREFDFNGAVPMPELMHVPSCSTVDLAIAAISRERNVPVENSTRAEMRKILSGTEDVCDYWEKMPWWEERYPNGWDDVLKQVKEETYKSFAGENSMWDGKTYYELAEISIQNRQDHGDTNWYDWSIRNWGTKWNAYDCYWASPDRVYFSTAWSAPHPVVEALSERFPDVVISHRWADEDFGCNVGEATFKAGEHVDGPGYYENNSQAAKKLALELQYGDETPEFMRFGYGAEVYYLSDIESFEEEQYLGIESYPEEMHWPEKLDKWSTDDLYTPGDLLWFAHSKLKDEFPSVDSLVDEIRGDEKFTTRTAIERFLESRGLKEIYEEGAA